MADVCVPERVVGRVIRKFSTYSQFYFLQITWPEISETSIFPVIVKLESFHRFPRVRPGDIVSIKGAITNHASDHYNNTCFAATEIEVVEPWDSTRMGVFQYQGPGVKGGQAHSLSLTRQSKHLVLALQCQVDVIERVESYMSSVYCTSNSKLSIRQSLAAGTSGHDRLLLLHHPEGLEADDILTLSEKITNDPVLTYVIKRVYTFPVVSTVVGTSLSETLSQLSPDSPDLVCRIHSFPKHVDMDLIGRMLIPRFAFHPKSFNSVLNIVFADGFHYASIVDKSIALSCGEHLSELSSNESLQVSKAAAKIREAILRISFNPNFGPRANIHAKTCIDVGASPGGWSYFLRTTLGAARVIAVDMGKLAEPIPPGVEHWKMKGEDAITILSKDIENNNCISLYCCDMNCNPMDSIQLFLKAVPLMSAASAAVITLKRMERNAQKWTDLKTACISALNNLQEVVCLEEVHLIANTPNETTLLVALR